ncbi:MAG: hypothetical protein GF355_14040 [Candidatus Eisenbacteria bacterium]|nr:hypothetical protein [Candidatus Eisenbacteria bacterium]
MNLAKGLIALLLGVLVLVASGAAPDRGAAQDARLVIYVRVADEYPPDLTLTLAALHLSGATSPVSLNPRQQRLNAPDVAGRTVRLVDQIVPPGAYESLILQFQEIEGMVGKAHVRLPDRPAATVVKPGLDLEPGAARLLVVEWRPHPLDPDTSIYRPYLRAVQPDIPPLGSLVFVSNSGADYISIIDRQDRAVVGVLRTGEGPSGLAFSPRSQRLFIACTGSDEILAVDALSRRVIRAAKLSFGDEPTRILLSDDEETLFVLNSGSRVLSVLDAAALQELSRVPLPEGPGGMAVDPRTGRLYVSAELAGEILVFDPALGREVRRLSIPAGPGEIALDPTAGQLHVASPLQKQVLVLDLDSGGIAARFTLCSPPSGMVFDSRSRRLYAAASHCRELAILMPSANLMVDTARLPAEPGLIELDRDARELLIALPDRNQLLVYSLTGLRPEAQIEVGDAPYMGAAGQ